MEGKGGYGIIEEEHGTRTQEMRAGGLEQAVPKLRPQVGTAVS